MQVALLPLLPGYVTARLPIAEFQGHGGRENKV